jgi:hypothetical protein
MLIISMIIPILAATGVDPMMMVVLVVVGLILIAVSGIGAKPRKKKYCPFCGRNIGSAKTCPYCGETV